MVKAGAVRFEGRHAELRVVVSGGGRHGDGGQIVGVALRAGKVHVVAASRGQWPRPFVENADGAMDPWRPVQPSRECVWNLGLYGCSASVVLLLRCRVILLDVSWYHLVRRVMVSRVMRPSTQGYESMCFV